MYDELRYTVSSYRENGAFGADGKLKQTVCLKPELDTSIFASAYIT